MKKLCYADEKMSIILNLLNLFMFLGVIIYSFNMISKGEEYGGYIGLICIVLLLELFYILKFVKPILKVKIKYKKIKKNGTKFEGYITHFSYERYWNIYLNNNNKDQFKFTLNIKYGKNSVYKTPELGFNPIRDLGSRECSIYVFNNEVYATDFVKRKFSENYLWDENDESILNYKKRRKEYFERNKSGIIIAIIFLIAVFGLIAYQIIGLFK